MGRLKMDITKSAETLVKQRYRIEMLVACIAIATPFSTLLVHKYWLYGYLTHNEMLAWLLLFIGPPLGPFAFWAMHVKKKLSSRLGNKFKNDLDGEIKALQALNDPTAWAIYMQKSRLSLICIFLGFAQIAGAYAVFAFDLSRK